MEFITQEFLENKWVQTKNTENEYIYEKDNREFSIKNKEGDIHVSVPLLESQFNYVKKFKQGIEFNYIYDYITNKLDYFENTNV